MRAVDLEILENRLSEYVRLAAGGERVLVTDRDRVVAELGPPEPGRGEALENAVLADAVRRGWLTAPTSPGTGAPPRLPVAPLSEILAGLDRDREDR